MVNRGPAAIVVVPARDEAARIGACLEALAAQRLEDGFAVIVVLDGCRDATGRVAAGAAASHGLDLRLVPGPRRGAGAARRAGMELAAAQLLAAGRADGLIATTDADTRPAPDWLARQLAHVGAGAGAIGGRIDLDADELAALPEGVAARRVGEAAARLARVRVNEPDAEHHHFAGASLAVRADAYAAVGGIEPLASLEDEAFATRLRAHGVPIARPADVRVCTSARATGRSARGLAVDLDVAAWLDRRCYAVEDFDLATLAATKGTTTVSVIVPAKQAAGTIAGVLAETVGPLGRADLVEEVLVVDAASADGTAAIAAAAGARVLQQDRLLTEYGPALGKGDAMWRAVHAARGDIVCFLDGDTADPTDAHLRGLLGPLFADPSLVLVKGAFDRPRRTDAGELPNEGGRVTELMARPLLNLHVPRLAGFSQPLAGEFAGRRDALRADRLPGRLRRRDRRADRRAGAARPRRPGRDAHRQPPATPTSRSGRSARWPTRCSPPSSGASAATAASRAGTTAGPGRTGRSPASRSTSDRLSSRVAIDTQCGGHCAWGRAVGCA